MYLAQQEIDLVKQYLLEKVSPYLIIIFGSAITGNMLPESDVDIAFLTEQKYSTYYIFMVGQGLADILDRDVDLVDLGHASTVFQARVVTTGKVIYCEDEDKRILFHMLTLKKYARLNEERRCVMNKITGRGSMYE
ncbi:Predicted nucleotidyltransferase [Desulfotomaculum arcticum]|uniref:Predicted nucleotidyltransferase n=1 Tax=Desulfotruncus arcticus DSM 17038 TaxID=1121424 RepID=A0A1I2P7U5_9FIRM|nr:nucleotidyltransferase domain-containing protein [Desulfotruncus arcticus]SFG12198.1 Predicted nucleotidyltransferase [Desulfotomaculum arcticum] [Desulfotruncus arcticus DSM 17038]